MKKLLRVSMMAVLVAGLTGLVALAQQPRPGGGGFTGQGGPTSLIRSKTVMADVKITDDQAKKLSEWAKDYQAKNQETMKAKFGEFKDLPREEMAKKFAEFQGEQSKEAYKQIGTVLEAGQVKRLQQIEVQVAGTRAFGMKSVQDALKITDDQKTKLAEIGEASRKESTELRDEYGIKGFGGAKIDADKMKEYTKKNDGITAATMMKIKSVLSDDQKKSWSDLTGDKIDVAKIQEEGRAAFTRKKDD